MMRRSRYGALAGLATLGLSGVAFGQATAQQGGVSVTADVDSAVIADSNRALDPDGGDSSLVSETTIDLMLRDRTRLSELALGFGGALRAGDASVEQGLADAYVDLSFGRETPDAAVSAGVRHESIDLSFADPLTQDEIEDNTISATRGDRETTFLSAGVEIGRQAPIGVSLDLSHRSVNYTDTFDPDLFDSETDRATVAATLRVSPAETATLSFGIDRYEAEDADATRRDTTTLNLGYARDLSPVTSIDAGIGLTEIDEDLTAPGAGAGTDRSNATARIAVNRDLSLGEIGLSATSSLTSTGQRNNLEITRAFERRRDSLSARLGISDSDSGDLETIAAVDYTRRVPAGELGLSFSRSVTTSDDSDDLLITRAGASYTLSLSARDRLSLGADVTDISEAGAGNTDDEQRGSLSASWSREVTRDWGLSLGYEFDYSDEAGRGVAESHSVSLSLGRSFSFRP